MRCRKLCKEPITHVLTGPLQGHGPMPHPQVQAQGLLGPLALGNDQGHLFGAVWPMGGQFDPQNSIWTTWDEPQLPPNDSIRLL